MNFDYYVMYIILIISIIKLGVVANNFNGTLSTFSALTAWTMHWEVFKMNFCLTNNIYVVQNWWTKISTKTA